MPDLSHFKIIGENIHCTRAFKRKGARITETKDGRECLNWKDGGRTKLLPLPDSYKETSDYQAGNVRHVAIAVEQGMSGTPENQARGREYLQYLATRQIAAGSHYLDVNVDQISTDPQRRRQAMKWIVPRLQEVSPVPLAIDSSQVDILRAGLEAYDAGKAGGQAAMVNSISSDRLAAAELAVRHQSPCIVMVDSETGMPNDTKERLENAAHMIARLTERGLRPEQLYLDCLVYPIGTTPEAGRHYLEAVEAIREKYGTAINIAGGYSNVSIGLPARRLINAVFIYLAAERGANAGIINPLECHPQDLEKLDPESASFQMARAGLLGEDTFCLDFITAYREGRLEDPFEKK